jgi:hypothetical protein
LNLTIQVLAGAAWQNPSDAADVNRDGRVTSLDALLIINELNLPTLPRALPSPRPSNQAELPEFDVSGDDRITPWDALLVINALEGPEGESDQPVEKTAGQPDLWLQAYQQVADPLDWVGQDTLQRRKGLQGATTSIPPRIILR